MVRGIPEAYSALFAACWLHWLLLVRVAAVRVFFYKAIDIHGLCFAARCDCVAVLLLPTVPFAVVTE
jgi:hypothetical protein